MIGRGCFYMVDHNIKKWVLRDEKKQMWKQIFHILIPLTLLQVIPVVYLIMRIVRLLGHMFQSLYSPDYATFLMEAGVCVVVVAASTFAKEYIKRTRYGYIRMAEKGHGEDAYIEGDELVLSGRIGKKRSVLRFHLPLIYGLESRNGRTAFCYRDPSKGIIKFTCLDYYRPQIATMLHEKGIK